MSKQLPENSVTKWVPSNCIIGWRSDNFFLPLPPKLNMLMARKKEDKKEHKKPWQETYATMEEIERFVDDRVATSSYSARVMRLRRVCRCWQGSSPLVR